MTEHELLQQRIDASKEAIRQTDLLLLQEMDQEDRGDWPHDEPGELWRSAEPVRLPTLLRIQWMARGRPLLALAIQPPFFYAEFVTSDRKEENAHMRFFLTTDEPTENPAPAPETPETPTAPAA